MAQMKMPSEPKMYATQYRTLLGVDFQKDVTDVDKNHSPNMVNVSEYDANRNGIVDNAESVNGYTVESNVPQNAEFTDTKYDTLTSLMIDDICDL